MSAGRPYTQRFILSTGASPYATWVCPGGHRAVITSIVSTWGATGSSFLVAISSQSVYRFVAPAPNNGRVDEMRLAIYAGELLQTERSAEMYGVTITGYIFEDTAGPLGLEVHSDRRLDRDEVAQPR